MANSQTHPFKRGFVGERFGRLTIIADVPIEERMRRDVREVECKCDCGNIVRVRSGNLFSGNTTSCGCFEKEHKHERHIAKFIGKRFGRLVVIGVERDYINPGRNRYICRCDCGNMHTAIACDLERGMTKSCGCYRKSFNKERMTEDITGQTFNELTAIKQLDDFVGNRNYRRTKWLFKCSCGKEIEALAVNVKHGKTKSCGHIGKSAAEYEINKWLQEHNINYKKEASFDNLRNQDTGRKYKFDFKLYRSDGSFFLIEHQGWQHFFERKDNKNFGRQQREITDKIKKNYCIDNNITLYETFYNEDYISKLERIITNEIGQVGDAYKEEVKAV